MMELGSADLVFLCFCLFLERIDSHCVCFEENQFRFCFGLRSSGLEESLLSLAKLRLEEVWKSFTKHTKRVDVWLKNDSEKDPLFSYVVFTW